MLVRILDELVSFCKHAHVLLYGLRKDGSCFTSSHYYKGGMRLYMEKSLCQLFTPIPIYSEANTPFVYLTYLTKAMSPPYHPPLKTLSLHFLSDRALVSGFSKR